MRQFTSMFIFVVSIVLLILPFVLVLSRNPQVSTFFPVKSHPVPNRYSVENTVKGYALSFVDTSYIDYMTAKLNVFAANAIVGSGFYTGKAINTKYQQINHITFALVDRINTPISIIGNTQGLDCQGEYILDGSTLIDRVVVGFDALGKQKLADKFAWENSFLRCALNTLYYAKGENNSVTSYQALVGIKEDIDSNVYSGLFVWPFRITHTSL